MARILIVEDDKNLATGLAYNLERAGYETATAADGVIGLECARSGNFDLLIVDYMMPRMNGIEMLRALRAAKILVPVMMLSAIDEEVTIVSSFDLGAVDYVVKPFGLAELLARVRLRMQATPNAAAETLVLGKTVVHFDRLAIARDGRETALTPTEAEVLRALVRADGRAVTRDDLIRSVWGVGGAETRALDTHVARLRKKIEDDPADPRILVTVHGTGYRLAR